MEHIEIMFDIYYIVLYIIKYYFLYDLQDSALRACPGS